MAYANNCLLVLSLMVLTIDDSALRSENISLSEAVLFIARERLSSLTSTIVIAENSITSESAITNVLLLEYILRNLDGRIAVQFYMRDYLNQPLEYYIFIVDSLEAFKEIYRMFTDNFYERQFRFLIVLTNFKPDFLNIMEEVFKLCHDFDVIDVNIIADHPTEGVGMFTYFLYAENVCRRCVPILLYRFSEGFQNFRKVFPEKLQNLHGCSFRISGRFFPPFVSFSGNSSDPKPVGAWRNLWGIEGTLLKYLAKTLNFTIDLRPFPLERSFVEGNRSSGCFSELIEHQADMAIGGFVDSNNGRWICSPTSAYHNSQFMYVVRGRRSLSSLDRLAKPFTYQVWYLVAAFIFINLMLILILKIVKLRVHQFIFGEENQNPVTNFLALFLGYPVSRTPHRTFARYVFLQLLLFTLVLRNAYQGSLYDAFRMDRFILTPSGYNDLLKWNYTILLPQDVLESIIFPQDRIIKTHSDGYQSRLEVLDGLDGKYATVAIIDGYIDYLRKNLRNGTELLLLPEVIFNYQFVMFLSKHSIFLSVFNKKIKQLAAAGILAKVSSNFTSKEKILKSYFMRKSEKRPLRNKRLYALYIICSILIGVSMAVFCLEIISIRYRRLQWIFE